MTPSHQIITGLSGGVDSSVAALLLQQQGYRVSALFMKNWEEEDRADYCAAAVDLADATAVAHTLQIPLRTLNFASEYWDRVFEHFLHEYGAGRTPNPDILCNKEIKFRAFLDYALEQGADQIATGHYARIAEQRGEFLLLRGLDANKDQSYFLYTLNQHQLRHSRFPIGELQKPQVRQLAAQYQLITHDKRDSTGICFIGEQRFRDFLGRYLPAQTGEIVTPSGEVIGHHSGLMFYTIGQRQGLGIGGLAAYGDEPWFVAAKDLATNRLTVVQGDHPLLYRSELTARECHWVSERPLQYPITCTAKIRYRQSDQPCRVTPIGTDRLQVEFATPQRAVTAGQAIVFYHEAICLGGATIEN